MRHKSHKSLNLVLFLFCFIFWPVAYEFLFFTFAFRLKSRADDSPTLSWVCKCVSVTLLGSQACSHALFSWKQSSRNKELGVQSWNLLPPSHLSLILFHPSKGTRSVHAVFQEGRKKIVVHRLFLTSFDMCISVVLIDQQYWIIMKEWQNFAKHACIKVTVYLPAIKQYHSCCSTHTHIN